MHLSEAKQFWLASLKCMPNFHYKAKMNYSTRRVCVYWSQTLLQFNIFTLTHKIYVVEKYSKFDFFHRVKVRVECFKKILASPWARVGVPILWGHIMQTWLNVDLIFFLLRTSMTCRLMWSQWDIINYFITIIYKIISFFELNSINL